MLRHARAALVWLVADAFVVTFAADMPEMSIVPGGSQPGGPEYTFLISKYEITNEQFVIFLNEEKAALEDGAEAHVVSDASGNVFLGPSSGRETELQPAYWRLFRITNSGSQSWIEFRDGRYAAVAGRETHPVVGASWFGAVRYCNWLTVRTGLGEEECCYSDGPKSSDWHPAHVTYRQWVRSFTAAQRREWVEEFRGFRLPMDDGRKKASPYNEYYKAAAWNGERNTRYAFGRDTIGPADANYPGSNDPYDRDIGRVRTTPVGYYDGTAHDGFQTHSNGNLYGIYDLSGNVAELMEDCQSLGPLPWLGWVFPRRRFAYLMTRGGSWSGWVGQPEALSTSLRCWVVMRTETDDCVGFRVVRTAPPD